MQADGLLDFRCVVCEMWSVCDQDEDLDYECVLTIEGRSVVVDADVETEDTQPSLYIITCQLHQVTLFNIRLCGIVKMLLI